MPRTPCSDFWLVSTTIFAFYPYPYPSNWISIFKKIVARVHICSSTCGYGFTELACMALQKSQIPLLLTIYAAAKGAIPKGNGTLQLFITKNAFLNLSCPCHGKEEMLRSLVSRLRAA